MKIFFIVLCLLGYGFVTYAHAQSTLDIEASIVIPGYNDVAIPGDNGTRFSLTDDLDADRTGAFRLRYSQIFLEKHWVGILAAPLTIESHGILDKSIDFNGITFPEGSSIDAKFRFDSYRKIGSAVIVGTLGDPAGADLGGGYRVFFVAKRAKSGGVHARSDGETESHRMLLQQFTLVRSKVDDEGVEKQVVITRSNVRLTPGQRFIFGASSSERSSSGLVLTVSSEDEKEP